MTPTYYCLKQGELANSHTTVLGFLSLEDANITRLVCRLWNASVLEFLEELRIAMGEDRRFRLLTNGTQIPRELSLTAFFRKLTGGERFYCQRVPCSLDRTTLDAVDQAENDLALMRIWQEIRQQSKRLLGNGSRNLPSLCHPADIPPLLWIIDPYVAVCKPPSLWKDKKEGEKVFYDPPRRIPVEVCKLQELYTFHVLHPLERFRVPMNLPKSLPPALTVFTIYSGENIFPLLEMARTHGSLIRFSCEGSLLELSYEALLNASEENIKGNLSQSQQTLLKEFLLYLHKYRSGPIETSVAHQIRKKGLADDNWVKNPKELHEAIQLAMHAHFKTLSNEEKGRVYQAMYKDAQEPLLENNSSMAIWGEARAEQDPRALAKAWKTVDPTSLRVVPKWLSDGLKSKRIVDLALRPPPDPSLTGLIEFSAADFLQASEDFMHGRLSPLQQQVLERALRRLCHDPSSERDGAVFWFVRLLAGEGENENPFWGRDHAMENPERLHKAIRAVLCTRFFEDCLPEDRIAVSHWMHADAGIPPLEGRSLSDWARTYAQQNPAALAKAWTGSFASQMHVCVPPDWSET